MNKDELLADIVVYLTQEALKLESSASSFKEDVLDCDGATKSRYDTLRIEGSWVTDGLAKRLAEINTDLKAANDYSPLNSDIIYEGSLVNLLDANTNEITNVFILPFAAGYESEGLQVISSTSSLAKCLYGKKPGSKVTSDDFNYFVLSAD